MAAPQPVQDSRYKYFPVSNSLETDALYIPKEHRNRPKPSGILMSVTNMVKGALGAGILSIHVAYKQAGWALTLGVHIAALFYMRHCLGVLVKSAQMVYSRVHISFLTYPQLGRAACEISSMERAKRMGKYFGYYIDFIICVYLFGIDAVYILVAGNNVKKIVEGTDIVQLEATKPGYPGLRVYLAVFAIPAICIVQFRHLDVIARFSFVGNIVVGLCTFLTMYYAFYFNPKMQLLKSVKSDIGDILQMIGTIVVSLSCCSTTIPVENNMRNPEKFPLTLTIAMGVIFALTFLSGFFGYVAFREFSKSPVTVNYPKSWEAETIQILVVLMIIITFGLNFWIPFELVFNHMKPKIREERQIFYEHVWRTVICILIVCVAIIFPSVTDMVSFLGTFCVSNIAFIWPNILEALVYHERPGYGPYRWRLVKNIFLMIIGTAIFIIGTYNTSIKLFKTASSSMTSKSVKLYDNGSIYK